jgi:hypothetical protein
MFTGTGRVSEPTGGTCWNGSLVIPLQRQASRYPPTPAPRGLHAVRPDDLAAHQRPAPGGRSSGPHGGARTRPGPATGVPATMAASPQLLIRRGHGPPTTSRRGSCIHSSSALHVLCRRPRRASRRSRQGHASRGERPERRQGHAARTMDRLVVHLRHVRGPSLKTRARRLPTWTDGRITLTTERPA